MTSLPVSVARERLAAVIEDARRSGEPTYVTRRGRPVAVLLDPEVYAHLLDAADEATDRADLQRAREEDDFVPWEQVKADLGLA